MSFSVVGGGSGYSPPTLTYVSSGATFMSPLGSAATVYQLDSGTTWSVSSQLPGSTGTQRWMTAQATTGAASSGLSEVMTYYHQFLETGSYSVSGGGTGYSAPSVSVTQFGQKASLLLGTTTSSFWLDSGSQYSAAATLPGSSGVERWFASVPTGTVTGPGSLLFNYANQFYLGVSGGAALSQWYGVGALAKVSQPIAYGRSSGTGQRVSSYSVDGGPQTTVPPGQGNFTVSVTMNAPHTITFVSVAQYQVALDSVSSQGLASITPPTISGDPYWYDSGSKVSVSINGTWGRSGGQGTRLVSYSINGGTQVQVQSKGPVSVLSVPAISAPESITARSITQYLLDTSGGSVASITPTALTSDPGWYDVGTTVNVLYNYSWNETSGQGRLNAVSYAIDSAPPTPLPRQGGGTFSVGLSMDAPHQIAVGPVRQYLLAYSGGFGVTLFPQSQTGDGFYDASSSVTLTSDYSTDIVPGQERQVLTGYTLDSTDVTIGPNTTGTFTTPPIVMDSYHTLTFHSGIQDLVKFSFTDGTGSDVITPSSFAIQVNNTLENQSTSSPELWIDNGTSFTVAGVTWEGVDVKPLSVTVYSVTGPANVAIKARAYPANVKVVDLFGLAIAGAQVSARFANGTAATRPTNSSGLVGFGLVPIGTYQATVSSFGLTGSSSLDASTSPTATLRAPLSTPVVATLSVLVAAVLIALLVVRRRGRVRTAT